ENRAGARRQPRRLFLWGTDSGGANPSASPAKSRGSARSTNVSRVRRDEAPGGVPVPVNGAPNATMDLPSLPARLHQRVVFAQQETTDRECQRAEPPCNG